MKTAKELAMKLTPLGDDGGYEWEDYLRRQDFLSGFDLAIEMLRSESIRCNEPDPVRTGIEWADWLESRKG